MANAVASSETSQKDAHAVTQKVTFTLDTLNSTISQALAHPSKAPSEYWTVVSATTTAQNATIAVSFDVPNGEVDVIAESDSAFTASTVVLFMKWYDAEDQDASSITTSAVY